MCFFLRYDIILDMENTEEFKKALQKRNFYTTKDTGKIYLYALLLPFIFGIIFSYVCMFILIKTGVQFEEGANIIQTMFDQYLWFSIPFILLSQICFLLIFLLYNKFNRIQQKSCCISFKKANIVSVLLSIFVGIFCVLGFVLLIEGGFGNFFRAIGLKQDSAALPLNSIGWLFVNLLLLGVLPGIVEELVFRGMIFKGLKEKFSPIASILLSSLLFALMHQNIQQFIYPFILGCILAVVMSKTNNLLYPILIHIFNNFTTIILQYLFNNGTLSFSFINMPWWLILIGIIVAVATCALLYVLYRFYLVKQKKVEYEKMGQEIPSKYATVGKFPITLVVGILIAVVFTVINAVG